MTRVDLRAGVAALGCLAAVLLVAGCSGGNTPGNDTSGTDDNVLAIPSDQVAPGAPHEGLSSHMIVDRGHDLGVHGANVLLRVTWHSGETPPGRTLTVPEGQVVEVQAWSDRDAALTVSGHPGATVRVKPGDPRAVDFTMGGSATRISIGGTQVATVDPA